MSAVVHGHARVVELLLRAGADPNESSRKEGTCLEIASSKGFRSIVEALLTFGADANAVGIHYNNALHAASACNQAEVVEVLLQHGAPVNGDQMNLGDFSQATAAQESFQLDKQTSTADVPQDALTSYLLPPHQQEQQEDFAASAFPQLISQTRNQSALPTMGIDPSPCQYAGPSDPVLFKRSQHNQSSQKSQHQPQSANVRRPTALSRPKENEPYQSQEEVLGARRAETLRTETSRRPLSLTEVVTKGVHPRHSHLEQLDSSVHEAPSGRTASPANTAEASSSSPRSEVPSTPDFLQCCSVFSVDGTNSSTTSLNSYHVSMMAYHKERLLWCSNYRCFRTDKRYLPPLPSTASVLRCFAKHAFKPVGNDLSH